MSLAKSLSRKIKESTGMGIPEFCKAHLNANYKAFQYRVRTGRFKPNEIIYISWLLGESVQEIFGQNFVQRMIYDGDPGVTEKLQAIWNGTFDPGKMKLLLLLGGEFKMEEEVKTKKEVLPELATDEVKTRKSRSPRSVVILPKEFAPEVSKLNSRGLSEAGDGTKKAAGGAAGIDELFRDIGVSYR